MSKIKKKEYMEINSSINTSNIEKLSAKTGNIYEALNIMSKRSRQISHELKEELHAKLEEFATSNDNLEEIFENREQIEISKFYERLPDATILSTNEFMNDKIYFRYADEETSEEDSEETSK